MTAPLVPELGRLILAQIVTKQVAKMTILLRWPDTNDTLQVYASDLRRSCYAVHVD